MSNYDLVNRDLIMLEVCIGIYADNPKYSSNKYKVKWSTLACFFAVINTWFYLIVQPALMFEYKGGCNNRGPFGTILL